MRGHQGHIQCKLLKGVEAGSTPENQYFESTGPYSKLLTNERKIWASKGRALLEMLVKEGIQYDRFFPNAYHVDDVYVDDSFDLAKSRLPMCAVDDNIDEAPDAEGRKKEERPEQMNRFLFFSDRPTTLIGHE